VPWYVAENKAYQAWADLLACHRLARLAGQGPTLVEALVAFSFDGIALAGDKAMLQHLRLTAAETSGICREYNALPTAAKVSNVVDFGERLVWLDAILRLACGGINAIDVREIGASKTGGSFDDALTSMRNSLGSYALDWDVILRMNNFWLDQTADACRRRTHASRKERLLRIKEEMEREIAAGRDWKRMLYSLLTEHRRATSRSIGLVMLSLNLPSVTLAIDAEDRATMQFELTKLGFSLAAYRADHGSYPAKLADLTPKHAAEVPKDIFNRDADLHYELKGDGYQLYSVGINGKDDGGQGAEDREGCDDLSIRVPAEGGAK
jgi:hypothetical protein